MSPRVIPLLHPAACLRGRMVDQPIMITHLKRWAAVAKNDPLFTPEDVTKLPPNTTVFPSPAQFQQFADKLRSLIKPCLSLDIESAGQFIICIGMTALDLESGAVGDTINLPIRLRGGRQCYSRPVLEQHVLILDSLLSDESVALVTHNGVAFDIPELEDLGFTVNGPIYDTMLLANLNYSEFPKSLAFCATLYSGTPPWKQLVRDFEQDEKG